MSEQYHTDLAEHAAGIVVAYVRRNSVSPNGLKDLLTSVHLALTNLCRPDAEPAMDVLAPPVPIKNSVTADYLISLEDGRKYKTLKRHLAVRGLTPEAYRKKWSLPVDYPMVAANYSAHRSELAKERGLGHRPKATAVKRSGRGVKK